MSWALPGCALCVLRSCTPTFPTALEGRDLGWEALHQVFHRALHPRKPSQLASSRHSAHAADVLIFTSRALRVDYRLCSHPVGKDKLCLWLPLCLQEDTGNACSPLSVSRGKSWCPTLSSGRSPGTVLVWERAQAGK